jgi:MFS family permease
VRPPRRAPPRPASPLAPRRPLLPPPPAARAAPRPRRPSPPPASPPRVPPPKPSRSLRSPLGALLFGHIGDTRGRNRCLLLSILCMAFATATIGILPTYDTGKYRAGIAAPILLALLRILQGLAMGGEFGSAVIYISELAPRAKRGTFVAVLQMSVNVGMILATLLVMLLQNTLDESERRWGGARGRRGPRPALSTPLGAVCGATLNAGAQSRPLACH